MVDGAWEAIRWTPHLPTVARGDVGFDEPTENVLLPIPEGCRL